MASIPNTILGKRGPVTKCLLNPPGVFPEPPVSSAASRRRSPVMISSRVDMPVRRLAQQTLETIESIRASCTNALFENLFRERR